MDRNFKTRGRSLFIQFYCCYYHYLLLIILFKDPRKRHQLVSACNQKSITRELLTLCRIVRLPHLIGSWWRVVLRTEQHSMIMRATIIDICHSTGQWSLHASTKNILLTKPMKFFTRSRRFTLLPRNVLSLATPIILINVTSVTRECEWLDWWNEKK